MSVDEPFFLMSKGSFSLKIRFLGQKVCSVTRGQTDRHESENRGHPFKVSGFFFKFSFNLSSRNGPIMMIIITVIIIHTFV